MIKKGLIFLAILIITSLLSFFFFWQRTEIPKGIKVDLLVKEGMATSQIAAILENKGLIKSAKLFAIEVKTKGYENSLQAGQYEIISGMSDKEILDKLVKGDVKREKITIPEGYGVKQIASLLDEKNIVKKETFLTAAKNFTPYSYMETDDTLVEYKTEGFLFPSTYFIYPGMNEKDILTMMVKEFDRQLTPEIRKKIEEKGRTIREFITFASLVEKEAAVEEDRPYIAKAFIKRLDIHMPLQSCATIQYILGYPKPELTIADTQIESPYNTYLNYGLPPGPIANPGLASMKAVLNPADEDYLFFVVQKNGKHIFSKTYSEHLAAIEKVSE